MFISSLWELRFPRTGAIGVTAAVVCSLVAITGAFYAAPAGAGGVSFKDFPYLIYCQYKNIDHAYYFSQVGPDGHAIYLTADGQAGAITIDGTAKRVGGDGSGSCGGKTLNDLRASGQAFDLPH